jgi:hypothetical protein
MVRNPFGIHDGLSLQRLDTRGVFQARALMRNPVGIHDRALVRNPFGIHNRALVRHPFGIHDLWAAAPTLAESGDSKIGNLTQEDG